MYEEQNKNGLPHNKTQKKISFAKIAGSAALAFCLTASLGLNIYQLKESAKQSKKLNKFIDGQLERQAKEAETKNLYQEDGFLIGNEYEIRSTKVVSDAYLKGDDSNLKEEDKQTLKMASAILNKIIKNGMNNYEKELAVYNWMYQNIKQGSGSTVQLPGTSRNAYTPYHVLNGKNAVCVGYATTFRLFMNMLGMDCHIVHNDYHSWDLVQLDDQEWYQVDIYTDVSGNIKILIFQTRLQEIHMSGMIRRCLKQRVSNTLTLFKTAARFMIYMRFRQKSKRFWIRKKMRHFISLKNHLHRNNFLSQIY